MSYSFSYRLTGNTPPTTQREGYTMWHLLAAELLSQREADSFLYSTHDVDSDTLLDDLREGMTFFAPHYLWAYRKYCPMSSFMDWDVFWSATAWKSPLQICVQLGRPLLSGYEHDPSDLPPVVRAFVLSTYRRVIGL